MTMNDKPLTANQQKHLSDNPICEICYKNERIKDATQVSHKIKRKIKSRLLAPDNLISLCEDCYNEKVMQ